MRSRLRAASLPLLLALAAGPVRAAETVAVFDPELLDTSGEGVRPDQQRRLLLLGEELRQALAASGRYTVVEIAPQRARLAEGPALHSCGACAAEAARALGAGLGIVTVVHKVSNLILGISLSVLDAAPPGTQRAAYSVEIRGNTDESWLRGLRWLLRNRLLAVPDPPPR